MSKITRFEIHVDANWRLSINADGAGAGWPLERNLRSVTAPGYPKFPRPPEDDLPSPADPWFPLCQGEVDPLIRTYRNIRNRQPDTGDPGDIELFGRYLFQTLIGQAWQAMLDLAKDQDAKGIDLALSWAEEVGDLHRLNWEMMHGPQDFLAARPLPTVAITRMVSGTTHAPPEISLPPRILFVVGSSLTDPDIQPGYEIYSLLYNLKLGGRSVNSRLLERAKPSELEAVIEEFRPHVVHFICHGNIDQTGRGFLELELDEEETSKQRFASQLLQYLSAQGNVPLPPIVVLSACLTGSLLGPSETGPLAAELVAGGVPIIIGMAGRVSDLACRLFTRRFADALVQGVPLVLATAQGRRFAFAHGHAPHKSVDWAFPTLFASTGVAADYAPTPAVHESPGSDVDRWIGAYDLERKNEPVFCDRNDCFAAYYQLFHGKPVLMVRGARNMGKSRMIRELTAQAIRDGHVPIMISSDDRFWEPPKTMDELRKELMQAIVRASTAFGLDSIFDQLNALKEPVDPGNPTLTKPIKDELAIEGQVTAKALLLALASDLNELMKQAQAGPNPVKQAANRPIVLLDQVHLYDRDFLIGLDQALGRGGLGLSEAEPIPLVVAFEPTPAADKILKSAVESQKIWLTVLDLEPFPQEKNQDLMAYRRVLLNPFNKDLFPNVSDKAFAINQEAKPEDLAQWCEWVRISLGGVPGRLVEPTLYVLADVGTTQAKGQVLIKGDDLVFLEQIREGE